MRILVSNDDGIYSPGLAALAEVASEFGTVRVVAPDVEQSSMGHAITATRPLSYRATHIGTLTGYRVNGTPADCVALGAYHWGNVDVVLSGINLGPNLGNSIWHSGTVAAAKQAALLGVRGVALSAPIEDEDEDFSSLEPWVERVLEALLGDDDCPDLVNVNFPRKPHGLMWVAQAVDHYAGRVVPQEDPMGRQHYWFTVVPLERHREGTDLWAFEQGHVSMTPLRLDLTHYDELDRVREGHRLDERTRAERSV